MFERHVVLDPAQHKHLRLRAQSSLGFAAQVQLIPVVAREAQAAAEDFVLVFGRSAAALPQLVTGLGDGRNVYVDAQGSWRSRFVPAWLSSYPFLLAEQPADGVRSEAQRAYSLRVVPDAPHFASGEGEVLINEEGAPTAALQAIQRGLAALQADAERTQFLVQALDDAGLLVEAPLPVGQDGARGIGLQGVRVLSKARFDALKPSEVEALRASGALALAQAHVQSLKNLRVGPLAQAASRGSHVPGALGAALAGLSGQAARDAASAPSAEQQADAAARLRGLLGAKK